MKTVTIYFKPGTGFTPEVFEGGAYTVSDDCFRVWDEKRTFLVPIENVAALEIVS